MEELPEALGLVEMLPSLELGAVERPPALNYGLIGNRGPERMAHHWAGEMRWIHGQRGWQLEMDVVDGSRDSSVIFPV
jgi:hypothetical protein